MVAFIHDGSFEGFLTSVYEAYYSYKKPDEIFSEFSYEGELFYESINIVTNEEKHEKVYKAIKEKIGTQAMYNIYYCFLCGDKYSHSLAYKYIKLGFKIGKDIDLHLHNPIVLSVINCVQKVQREKHRILGFVRFKDVKRNLFYASIEPDHNILPLLGNHFSERLPKEKWIIHDLKRNIAIVHKDGEWVLCNLYSTEEPLNNSKDEDIYEKLWKQYFVSTTIKERTNYRLQKHNMPKRYWKHLLETKTNI